MRKILFQLDRNIVFLNTVTLFCVVSFLSVSIFYVKAVKPEVIFCI